MSYINQEDGTYTLSNDEAWDVTIAATVRITVRITDLSQKAFDDLSAEDIAEAIREEYDLDAEVTDFDVLEMEASE